MTLDNNDLSVVFDNISDLSDRKKLISEQIDICFSIISETLRKNGSIQSSTKDVRSELFSLISKYCNVASRSQSIAFLRELTKDMLFPESLLNFDDDSYELFSSNSSAVISYVKNNYNDSAYLHFSKLFGSSKVSYGNSFEEICENVYNGICDYCILPTESVDAGKLFSFYSLIDKYDLKIIAVADIDEGHSAKRTRYSLLSRNNVILPYKAQTTYFEFSVIRDDSYDLSDILEAAKICSIDLYRIDTIPVHYDDLAFKFYHIFELKGEDIIPFLIYIRLQYPQLKPLGYYTLI